MTVTCEKTSIGYETKIGVWSILLHKLHTSQPRAVYTTEEEPDNLGLVCFIPKDDIESMQRAAIGGLAERLRARLARTRRALRQLRAVIKPEHL